jgi:hypothetical protein
MPSADALIGRSNSSDSSYASRTLGTFKPGGSSLEKDATISTHRYVTPDGFVQPIFRSPSRRPPSNALQAFPAVTPA